MVSLAKDEGAESGRGQWRELGGGKHDGGHREGDGMGKGPGGGERCKYRR